MAIGGACRAIRKSGTTRALDRCFAERHPRLRGDKLDVGPFALVAIELHHVKNGALGLADIQPLGARVAPHDQEARPAARVGQRGDERIKNVLLFVELLAERGLVITANVEMFMPPTVLDELVRRASDATGACRRAPVAEDPHCSDDRLAVTT